MPFVVDETSENVRPPDAVPFVALEPDPSAAVPLPGGRFHHQLGFDPDALRGIRISKWHSTLDIVRVVVRHFVVVSGARGLREARERLRAIREKHLTW